MNAATLASLAGWIEDKLGDENADRQAICEDVAAQLRGMAAIRESVTLDAAQLGTVLDALDDATEYRLDSGAQCAGCDATPDGLCEDHTDDLERGQRYAATARQLRMETGR